MFQSSLWWLHKSRTKIWEVWRNRLMPIWSPYSLVGGALKFWCFFFFPLEKFPFFWQNISSANSTNFFWWILPNFQYQIFFRDLQVQNFFSIVSLFDWPIRRCFEILKVPNVQEILHFTHTNSWFSTSAQLLYRSQEDNIGQSIWDKVMCYWEPILND